VTTRLRRRRTGAIGEMSYISLGRSLDLGQAIPGETRVRVRCPASCLVESVRSARVVEWWPPRVQPVPAIAEPHSITPALVSLAVGWGRVGPLWPTSIIYSPSLVQTSVKRVARCGADDLNVAGFGTDEATYRSALGLLGASRFL
jgi:hypothetical protein